jgi:hypothetical protein
MMEFGEPNQKAQERFLRHLRGGVEEASPSRVGRWLARLIGRVVLWWWRKMERRTG